MIYGIGIDLINTQRMKDVIDKWGEKFLERVFTEDEIAYCYKRKEPYLSLSVRFAAKEALIKAMGPEISASFRDIEILNYDNGKPSIRVKNRLEEFFKEKEIKHSYLTLSHEKEFSIACVVLER